MTRKKELPKPLYIQCSNFLTAIEYISSVTFWFVKMIVKSQFVAQMAQTNSSNWVGPVHKPVPLNPGRMPFYSQLKMAHLWPPILSLLLNQVPLLMRNLFAQIVEWVHLGYYICASPLEFYFSSC
jgi:hypothetical protein